MPYDSNGNYSLPTGYLATTGQTVLASQHNGPIEDIESALSSLLLRSGVAPMTANLPMGGNKITGMADGTADTDAATFGQLGSAIPVGVVVDFAGNTAPTGWVFCYGQAVSRTTYSSLFSAVGTTYGIGDGSTTFNLPDCRGRTTAGRDDMGGTSADRLTNQTGGLNGDTLGATGGAETHALTTAQLAGHTHTFTSNSGGGHQHAISASANDTDGSVPGWYTGDGSGSAVLNTGSVSDHTHGGTTNSSGSGSAHNNVQPTIIVNKIIKTGA